MKLSHIQLPFHEHRARRTPRNTNWMITVLMRGNEIGRYPLSVNPLPRNSDETITLDLGDSPITSRHRLNLNIKFHNYFSLYLASSSLSSFPPLNLILFLCQSPRAQTFRGSWQSLKL